MLLTYIRFSLFQYKKYQIVVKRGHRTSLVKQHKSLQGQIMSFWSKIPWSFLSHAAVILWPWSAVILWPWSHVKITPPPIWVVAWLRWAGPTCWLCWTHSVGKKETGPLRPGGYLLWQNNLTYLADTSLLKKERDLQTSPSHLFSNSEKQNLFQNSSAAGPE